MKQRENKSLLKTNYNCWRVVSSPEDSSQLTKFEGNRLVDSHDKTGFLQTSFDKPVSILLTSVPKYHSSFDMILLSLKSIILQF